MLKHRTLFQMHFKITNQPFERKSRSIYLQRFSHSIRKQRTEHYSVGIDRFQIITFQHAAKSATTEKASFEPNSFFIAETNYR